LIAGVAGIVRDGILPGSVGYETGQAAMGDAFDFVRRLSGFSDFAALDQAARAIAAGGDGLICLDWFNGCRTPLMDASLTGAFIGLTLHHTPAHVYRAVLESAAFGLRVIVETLREGGVVIDRFIATGGLPRKNPLFMEIVASVLEAPVEIHAAEHGPALGAAILGALAAGADHGGFDDVSEAVDSMAGRDSALPAPTRILPDRKLSHTYEHLFLTYQSLARVMAAKESPMRKLHEIMRKRDGDDSR
jgi:L-ribulokinase